MALTGDQEEKLRTVPQRADVRFGIFPQFTIEVFAAVPGEMIFKAMVRISPRYSMVWAGDSIDLYGGDSYLRGGGGVSTWAWTVEEGTGVSLVNASTATVTVVTTVATVAKIKLTVDAGSATEQYGYAYVKVYAAGTRGYDGRAQITAFRASGEQGGTEIELLCHDGAAAITSNVGILIWVQDYWNGVEETFGGYKYPEGIFYGYVVGETIKEDHKSQSVNFQVSSPNLILRNTQIEYTSFWTCLSGEYVPPMENFTYFIPYPGELRPVDCLWIIMQELTNFARYHGVVLWYDQNLIGNLQIDESDLWTILVDVMERTFGIVFCDRYGELKCVPHQVVRADEWWGTPSPILEFDQEMILEIEIEGLQEQPVSQVVLQALSSSLPSWFRDFDEIYAGVGEGAGRVVRIKGLICNDEVTLGSWAADVLDWKANKYWKVRLSTPLNHVLDIHEPCDIDYTPQRSGAPLATHHWGVESLEFRIDVGTGRWTSRYELYQTAAKV